MPPSKIARIRQNFILSRLSASDLALLKPHLEPVDLPLRRSLETRNRPIKHLYFPDSGFASVVANGVGNGGVEIGIIGREGMTGHPVLLGTDRSPNDTFMQLAGSGHRVPVAAMREAMDKSANLRRTCLNSAHVLAVQTGQTALSNGRAKLEERLARWLLMAHDRGEGDEMRITHEFLATMLGVRRAGVTIALNLLATRGLILAVRGVITIADRAGLIESTRGGYGAPEAELARVFG
jgi:CRP-like cAMP-binding protein